MDLCKIVYDLSKDPIHSNGAIECFFMLGFIAALVFGYIGHNIRKMKLFSKIPRIISISIFSFYSCWTISYIAMLVFFIFFDYIPYFKVLYKYNQGKYTEIAGVVHGLSIGNPDMPQAVDRFFIEKQNISYAVSANSPGFQHQGIIKDGIRIRIRYLQMDGWRGDAIAHLEICPSQNSDLELHK